MKSIEQRLLHKCRYSLSVNIPRSIVLQLGLQKGDNLAVQLKGNKIVYEKVEMEMIK